MEEKSKGFGCAESGPSLASLSDLVLLEIINDLRDSLGSFLIARSNGPGSSRGDDGFARADDFQGFEPSVMT